MSTSRAEGTAAYRGLLPFNDRSYKRGKKSDIFSLGVLLWEISSGKLPCEGCTQSFEVVKYRQQGYRDPPFPSTPEGYLRNVGMKILTNGHHVKTCMNAPYNQG